MKKGNQSNKNKIVLHLSDEMYQELLDAAYENDRNPAQEIIARLEDSLEFYRHGLDFSEAIIKFAENMKRINAIQSENQRLMEETLSHIEDVVPGINEQIETMMKKQVH
ncbi:MAG: TraY domain-containing protein [Magnetococcales bacterium]|nr:TraY domain-containing protein [Magnetococcales bacterium]